MAFTDRICITLVPGKGGQGSVHFQRTRRAPRAGPDGGNGGKGGDIILSPNNTVKTFSHLINNALYKAEVGKPGDQHRQSGAKGKDLIINVPEGTCCYTPEGVFLKELKTKPWCFLKGGKGGKGNYFFKTPRLQAPQTAQPGEAPVQQKIILEYKWLSDACLIGFRASGKTSFLLNISKKNEKLCPSAIPRLLSVKQSNDHSILFLDLPGITTSTKKFLKQAEKTKVIILFVSLLEENPLEVYKKLKSELLTYDKQYKTDLTKKPYILLLTGEENEISLKKAQFFKKQTAVKVFQFFTSKDSIQNQQLLNEIVQIYK